MKEEKYLMPLNEAILTSLAREHNYIASERLLKLLNETFLAGQKFERTMTSKIPSIENEKERLLDNFEAFGLRMRQKYSGVLKQTIEEIQKGPEFVDQEFTSEEDNKDCELVIARKRGE